jgi:predicted lipid carrier protein YhbT
MRFDLTEDGQVICYLITVDAGKLTVSRERLDANTVVHAPRPVFDRIASGLQNGMVAVLRGVISVEGDLELVVLLQRLLPGPPGQQPRTRAGIRTPAPANSVAKG